jgi:ZIP family zinc transporter
VKSGHWSRSATYLLAVDAVARVGGAALGTYVVISEPWVAVYLALFAGFIIYIATSHILPEAHSRHSSRYTMAATLLGVLIMWLVVSTL